MVEHPEARTTKSLEAIVIEKSLPAPPPTRITRGIALYRDHAGAIEPLGKGRYSVPGCSGGSYEVDLAVFGGEETCSCPDHARHPELTCKHLVAATIYRAKRRGEAHRAAAARREARTARGTLAPLVGA